MRFPVRYFSFVLCALVLGVALSSSRALAQSSYAVSQSAGVGITPGTTQVAGFNCADVASPNNDCVANVALPFAYTFYGQTFATANVSTNGVLQFSSANNDYGQFQVCLPLAQFSNAIFAHWTDLQTNGVGEGIFTSVTGDPGSRIFNVEWRASYEFLPPGTLNFEIRLYENQQRFDIVYGTVGGNGASAPGGGITVPTVGVQRSTGSQYTAFNSACGVAGGGLRNGLALTFTGTDNAARYIAGRISDPDGFPLSGVTVNLTGDTNAQTTTDLSGRYSFDNLAGSSYTVSASQGTASFYPASRIFGAFPQVPFAGSQIINFVRTPTPNAGDVLISEFRFRGPRFITNEFVELYNNTNSTIVVNTSDGSSGWTVQAANASPVTGGLANYILPRGTVIPPRAHFLVAGSGYDSLFLYAPGEDFFEDDIPDDNGVALFNTANVANLNASTRLDAVGFNNTTTPVAALYREGAGLTPIGANNGEYAFVRRLNSGLPQDTNDNASDFVFVSTSGATFGGVQSALGAPGPENLYDPIQSNSQIKVSYIDPGCVGTSTDPTTACARVRDSTPVANGVAGTLSIRRKWTNRTNTPVTRLRFRILDLPTLGNRAPTDADLRVLSSSDVVVNGANGAVNLKGLTLEQTPPTQTGGGGLNSSLRAGSITLAAPLAAGASINLEFRLGVQIDGNYRFFVNVEAQVGSAPPSASPGASANSLKTGGYVQQQPKTLPNSLKQP
ncbi:MAG: hypothetical protein QOF61_2792 [Acidobacteriota bacterium]|jgi:hypothetical protein|nr:hypothetical protein [Acidobacteriota bacterium]